MLEVEMKFPAGDLAELQRRVEAWGAKGRPMINEADHYFNAPDRDFAKTDEALRLRRIGAANFVTYKGPKCDPTTKTRTEIEVPLAEGDRAAEDFMQLLTRLGYRPVAVVRKQRQIFALERESFAVEVCLDDVEGVGRFAELEIVAPEERLDAARGVLQRLAGELGLSGSERRSYLEMLLTNQGGRGRVGAPCSPDQT
jgi:adenylate cyclase class 2